MTDKKRPPWMDEPHEFREDGNDYSMCLCGVPSDYHYAWEQQITDEGVAVVEAGLTVRQAHELRTGCSVGNPCARCISDFGPLHTHGKSEQR